MTADRILVLGAGGFLGSHVRTALRRSAASSVALVSRASMSLARAERWVEMDLASIDRAPLAGLLDSERPDVIVNCAGTTGGDGRRLVRANVVLVGELLAAITAVGREVRLVHLGSAAEYGPAPAGIPVTEEQPPDPTSPYGVTKLAATELVLSAGRVDGLDAVVLRVFNPIGVGQPPGTLLRRAAESMGDAARSGESVIRLGPLDAHRDFIAAEDVAEAVVRAATLDRPVGPRIINVGTGRATQARELVEIMAAVAGFTGKILVDEGTSPRSPDVDWQAADTRVAGEVLGWTASRGVEGPVRDLWEWVQRENRSGPHPAA